MSNPRRSSAVHEVRVRRPSRQISALLSEGLVPAQAGALAVGGAARLVTIVGDLHGLRFDGTWSIDGRQGPATVTVVEASRSHGGGGASLVSVCLHGGWSQGGLLRSSVVTVAQDLRACLEGGTASPVPGLVAQRRHAVRPAMALAT